MKIRPYLNKVSVVASILIVILVGSIVISSCTLEQAPSIVPITGQDIKFLKKCIGEDGTVHVAMRDSVREQIKEIVKDDGPRTLVSLNKHPFPPTIPNDHSELSSQCYHFIWDGSYNADDDFY